MESINLKFGILIDLNINNMCYLQNYNILTHYRKIDTFHYISELECGWEDLEHETDVFKQDMKTISTQDGFGQETRYYLVCYATNNDDDVLTTKKIKELFYE